MNSAVIDVAGLGRLVPELIDRGYRVVGPTVSGDAIVLAELASADDLPRGWGVDVGPGHHPLRHRDVGSEAGTSMPESLPHRDATPQESDSARSDVAKAAQHMGRQMPPEDLRGLLIRSRESPHWQEVADRCLTCGHCTMACPTCFCTSVDDVTDLTGMHAERWLQWSSCFEPDFSYVHGGNVRQSGASRYRHWLTHKLSSWHDQLGTSGCVGCGRFIAWCPTGIDITEEMWTLSGLAARSAPADPNAAGDD